VRLRRRTRLAFVASLALVAASCASGDRSAPSAPGRAPEAASDALDPEELARRLGDAVWRIDVDGCGIVAGGSAFAIAEDLVVTNRHVVEFDPRPLLTSRDGSVQIRADVIGMSDEVDLAVLRLDRRVDLFLEWEPTAALSEGQRVVALGFPAPFDTFSVAVGTLNAFEVVDSVRVGIISDESSDYGSSGGPLLTDRGRVAGIVTEFGDEGGRQILGVSLTYEAVRAELDRIVGAPQQLEEDCTGVRYGTDAVLDALWDWCEADAMWACDELFWTSSPGSDYETFGETCGDRVETDQLCTELFGAPEAFTRGDVDELDALWVACASGAAGWAAACDLLFEVSPIGSEYEAFGDSCGGRNEPSDWCEVLYP